MEEFDFGLLLLKVYRITDIGHKEINFSGDKLKINEQHVHEFTANL